MPDGRVDLHRLNANARRIWAERVEDMQAQPDGRVLVIFDADGQADFRVSGADWVDPARVKALLDHPAVRGGPRPRRSLDDAPKCA